MAHRTWRKSKLKSDWDNFTVLREKVPKAETLETYKEHSKLFTLNPKSLWNNIRKLGLSDKVIDNENNIFSSEDLNSFFIGDSASKINTLHYPLNDGNFSFRCIVDDETLRALKSVGSNALGSDSLHPKFLKIILPHIIPVITHIYNNILTCSNYPKMWKTARVVPIKKTRNPTSMSDYRPISILSYLSKSLEKIICNQLNEQLTVYDLLSPVQSGFREKRSTTTSLLNIVEDIRIGLDNNEVILLSLLDFSKSFR